MRDGGPETGDGNRSPVFSTKTILIFGAGLNQYLLIKAARDLGITSVVLNLSADGPGKELADY